MRHNTLSSKPLDLTIIASSLPKTHGYLWCRFRNSSFSLHLNIPFFFKATWLNNGDIIISSKISPKWIVMPNASVGQILWTRSLLTLSYTPFQCPMISQWWRYHYLKFFSSEPGFYGLHLTQIWWLQDSYMQKHEIPAFNKCRFNLDTNIFVKWVKSVRRKVKFQDQLLPDQLRPIMTSCMNTYCKH